MKSITQSDLRAIYNLNFGIKNTSTDSQSNLTGRNTPSKSVEVFSVSKLKQLERIEEGNKYIIHRKCKTSEGKEFWSAINEICIIAPRRQELEKIEKAKARKNFKPNAAFNVEKAKEYPITDLIEIKHRVTKCIFHNERSGSMYYYPKTNTVYCFGCHEYADSIKVYQKLNNCDFKTAVKALQ